jgi:hypothetical protein
VNYITKFTSTGTTIENSSMSQSGSDITVNSGSMTATAFYESSDIRLKNVLVREESSDSIDLITYTLSTDPKRKRLGYSAQEVMNVLPTSVSSDHNGYYTVDYKEVHAWKIMQLQKRIDELEAKLRNL